VSYELHSQKRLVDGTIEVWYRTKSFFAGTSTDIKTEVVTTYRFKQMFPPKRRQSKLPKPQKK
jgi:hypothetical protein